MAAPKVTLNRPPAAEGTPGPVQARSGVLHVTDATGRRIGVRRLNAMEKYRVLKAMGVAHSENRPATGMAMLAASVCEMDGVMEPPPRSEREIEAMIARLDDHGLAACADAFEELYPEARDTAEEDALARK